MSTPSVHAQLMRDMGAPGRNATYDPMPPAQHAYFLDIAESATARAIAWVWSKTIAASRRQKRSAFARDERGVLQTKHMAADLGITSQNATTVLSTLESQDRIRRDEKGRIYLNWSAREPRRTYGETHQTKSAACLCTKTIPHSISLYLKTLDPERAAQGARRINEALEYREVLERDAILAARAKAYEYFDQVLVEIGYQSEDGRGRPREDRELMVRLDVLVDPASVFVHKQNGHSVQNGSAPLYKKKNRAVQKPVSLLPFQSNQSSQSEVGPEPAEKTPSKPPTPPHSQKPNASLEPNKVAASPRPTPDPKPPGEVSEVIKTVEGMLGYRFGADPLAEAFRALAATHRIPERSVVRFLHDKYAQKRSAYYSIQSAGALYTWTQQDLPRWIQTHRSEIDLDAQVEERARELPGRPGAEILDDVPIRHRIEWLETWTADNPNHCQHAEHLEELERLRKKLNGLEPEIFKPDEFNARLKALSAGKGMS